MRALIAFGQPAVRAVTCFGRQISQGSERDSVDGVSETEAPAERSSETPHGILLMRVK